MRQILKSCHRPVKILLKQFYLVRFSVTFFLVIAEESCDLYHKDTYKNQCKSITHFFTQFQNLSRVQYDILPIIQSLSTRQAFSLVNRYLMQNKWPRYNI